MWLDPPIQATHHVRTMGHRLDTHLMQCANGSLYVVKIHRPERDRSLLAAMVGSRLTRGLGLPTVAGFVVEVSNFLLRNTPELKYAMEFLPSNRPSLHVATEYAGNDPGIRVVDYLPDDYLRSLVNRDAFAPLLALDKWISHLEPPQAVFIRKSFAQTYTAKFINRSSSFSGSDLIFQDSPENGVYDKKTVYCGVTGWDSFDPLLGDLVAISPDTVRKATLNLPFGWSSEYSRDLDIIVDTLLNRRAKLRQFIAKSRDQIPNLFPAWNRPAFVLMPSKRMGVTIGVETHANPR